MSRLAVALGLGLAIAASDPSAAQERFMGWGDSGPGPMDASPSCSSLPPENTLVVSFIAPNDVNDLERVYAYVDLCTAPDLVPEWWMFDAFPGCRSESLAVSADFSGGPFTHASAWNGRGVVQYTYGPGPTVNWSMVRFTVDIHKGGVAALPLVAGQQYYAFRIRFGNPAVGCGDCQKPACLVLNELRLEHDGGIVTGTTMNYSNYVSWQGGPGNCPFIVPALTSSWGRVKHTYR